MERFDAWCWRVWELWCVVGVETPMKDKPSHYAIDWTAFQSALAVGHAAFREDEPAAVMDAVRLVCQTLNAPPREGPEE